MAKEKQQNAQMTFAEAPVAPKKTLICVGSVGSVLEGKVSSTGNYVVQPIQIEPEGSGQRIRYHLLYCPEWLRPNFDPANPASFVPEAEDENNEEAIVAANKMLSVYRRNIAARNKIAALRGLAGSEEAYKRLANQLLSLPEITIPGVQEVMTKFFTEENEGVLFGYVLKQQRTKTDDLDENGKNIYVLDDRYEVDRFFDYNDKVLKNYIRLAEQPNSGMIVTFDPDLGY